MCTIEYCSKLYLSYLTLEKLFWQTKHSQSNYDSHFIYKGQYSVFRKFVDLKGGVPPYEFNECTLGQYIVSTSLHIKIQLSIKSASFA